MIFGAANIKRAIAKGAIVIQPFDVQCLKVASYTFHLGGSLLDYYSGEQIIDAERANLAETEIVIPEEGYLLQPGQFVVGALLENLTLDLSIACLLSVRGSCARLGLDALSSDLFVEPGWDGRIQLAMKNFNTIPVRLHSGMQIVKGIFFQVATEDSR